MSVYAIRIAALPFAIGLVGVLWAAASVLFVLDVIGHAALALVHSRYWLGLGPAIAFGGGVWLLSRGLR